MSSYQVYLDNPPIVFISYSWTNDEHIIKVLELAKRLRLDGIDVKIDKWDLKEGQDKYHFMEMMVKDESISKILIISDKKYAEKADAREGGVGTETQIITPEIYENATQTKFLPIIFERDENGKEYLPAFLRTRIYIDLSVIDNYDEEYNHLLRVLFDRPENQKPPIGTPPSYLFEEKATSVTKTISKVNQFKHLILDGKQYAIGAFEDYLEQLFRILESDFKVQLPAENNPPMDDLILESINSFIPYRDEFVDNINFLTKYRLDISYFELIKTFLTRLLNLFTEINTPLILDNYRFISWELFLYLVSILVHRRKIDEYKLFVDNPYFIENQYMNNLEPFTIFRQYIRSFEETRKSRLKSNAISISVNELHQRNYNAVPFSLLVQADLILFLRSKKLTEHNIWFPSTLIYSRGNKSEFFIKSEYKKEFNDLLVFLNYENKEELLSSLKDDQTLGSGYFVWSHTDIAELTNFDKLGTE